MANILNSLSKVSRGDVVLSVRDIKKTFMEGGQPLHILRGGGFDLHRGEIIALVGQSGSGKSTLLQCVGLLDRPSAGSILIGGIAAQKMDDEIWALKLLRAANVAHRASHLPGEMSGGEQQRTAVARALANGPEILLADEPTGSLDPAHAAAVFDLLLELVRKNKMAMLFVTHDMNLAARADRTITIKDGIVK